MALTPTDIQAKILKGNSLDKYEVRQGNSGFFANALKNQGNLIDRKSVDRKRSLEQAVKVPVLLKGHVGSNGGRVIGNIPNALGTASFVTLTSQVIQRHFSIQPAENFGNEISYQKEWDRVMRETQIEMMQDIDAFLQTQVNAVRSQADNSNAYPFVGNAYQVPNTDWQKVLNKIPAIYRTHKYPTGKLQIVANPMYASEIAEILEHASNNDQNKSLRLRNLDFSFSDNISPASEFDLYVSTDSGYEMQNFNSPDEILKSMVSEAEFKQEVVLPLLGLKVGLFVQKSFEPNVQGTDGTLTERYSFATNVTAITPYYSTPATDPAVITKYELQA